MGVPREHAELALEVLVEEGVDPDVVVERVQLLLVRQFAVDEEVAHLVEGGVLREVRDVVPAVAENPVRTVDVGDVGERRAGVDVAGVDRGEAGLGEHLPERDTVVALGGPDDVHLVLPAGVLEYCLVLILGSH